MSDGLVIFEKNTYYRKSSIVFQSILVSGAFTDLRACKMCVVKFEITVKKNPFTQRAVKRCSGLYAC